MKRTRVYVFLLVLLFAAGCRSEADTASATSRSAQQDSTLSQNLDFDALLATVDEAIGERMQAMQRRWMPYTGGRIF